jgi:hypothetical protein
MKALFVFLLSTACLGQVTSSDVDYVNKKFYPATVLLYQQDEHGNMRMACTATAISKDDSGYEFVSAGHCACVDDEDDHTVSPAKTYFYVTSDDRGRKDFLKADPTGCGYRHAGDDFALFHVDTAEDFPVIALGKDPIALEQVVNVASPLGLGKQVFTGTVSSANLDRPVIEDDINWGKATLLQLFGTDGGSSGSAVVCLDQKAICAFIVGSIDKSTIVSMPVSRLVKLREELKAGTYKHWKPDPDAVNKK